MNVESVPEELRERPQWVCWQEEERNGDLTKLPMQPDGSGFAKSNDMATWGEFETAVATADARGWGIGFVFSDADPYLGVDLDACVDDGGHVREWLQRIGTERFVGETYMERSPSGNGVHILLRDCTIPDWWTNVDRDTDHGHEEVAVFDTGRFFTVTGDAIDGAAVDSIGSVDFPDWLQEAWAEFEDGTPWSSGGGASRGQPTEDINIDVHDILLRSQYPAGERVAHPVHGSDTGSNFMVDDGAETWRCWRHGCTGDALHLIGIEEGIIECGQWTTSDVSSDEWRAIFEAARERGLDVGDEPNSEPVSAAAETAAGQGQPDGGAAATEPDSDGSRAPRTFPDRVRGDVLTPLDPPDDYDGEEITLEVAINRFADLLCEEYAFVRPRRDVRGWRDTLYVYDGESGIYEPHGESWIEHEAERHLGAVATNQRVNEIVKKIERRSLVRPGELTAEPHRLVVDNGILDLHTGELEDHTPDEYHRTRVDVAYDPDAECERIDEFFHEIVPDHHVRTLYQLVGHCLYKEYIAEKAAMLLGDGQNGKSVFLSLLEEFLGEYNVARRSLQDFDDNDFAANNLEGKLANLHPDMASDTVDELGVFKQLTGRDTLVADVKYERPIQYENHATLIFAANRMPKMGEDTHALWRRWIYVNFPYTFSDRDPDAKDPIPKRQLMAELTEPEQLRGLLARAVEELKRWDDGEPLFTDVAGPEQVREKMKRASEPVYDFAMTCLEPADDEFVSKEQVRQCYREFAREEDLPTIADNAFGERLLNVRDLPAENAQRRVDGQRVYVYEGIQFSGRGRQVLGLDGDDDHHDVDEVTGRWRTVVDAVRDLEGDQPVSKAQLRGRLSARMNQGNAERAIEEALERGAIYEAGDEAYRVSE
jgi:putative DNA primase/helicase